MSVGTQKRRNRSKLNSAVILGGVLVAGGMAFAPSAQAITLPAPGDPNFILGTTVSQLGDFYSYALPVLDAVAGFSSGPGSPFYVKSTAGDIKDYIVIATGASGTDVRTNPAGIDDAYGTPTGNSTVADRNFSTSSVGGADGYPTVAADLPSLKAGIGGQSADSWDANLAALATFTGGNKAVFMFNHNQTKSGGTTAEDLWAWGQIALTGLSVPTKYLDFTLNSDLGQTGGVTPYTYVNTLGAMSSVTPFPNPFNPDAGGAGTYPYGLASFGAEAGPGISTDWVNAPGHIVLPPSLGGGSIDMNLGANQAAYAIWSPELQAAIDNPGLGYTDMHLTVRFTGMNNGYEQLFLVNDAGIVPLPSAAWLSLPMLGAMIGLKTIRRRRENWQ